MKEGGKEKTDGERGEGNRGAEALNPLVTCRDVNQSDFSTQLGINPFILVIAALINHWLTVKAQCNFPNAQTTAYTVRSSSELWPHPVCSAFIGIKLWAGNQYDVPDSALSGFWCKWSTETFINAVIFLTWKGSPNTEQQKYMQVFVWNRFC